TSGRRARYRSRSRRRRARPSERPRRRTRLASDATAGTDRRRTALPTPAPRRIRRAACGCAAPRQGKLARGAATGVPAERAARRDGSSLLLRVPILLAGVAAGDRVQHLRVARLLEILERLAAHMRVDVQVRRADHRAELLEHEEDHAVLDHCAPITAPHHVALLVREPRFLERRFLILEKTLALLGYHEVVQEAIQAIRANARVERERIGAFELLDAGELAIDPIEIGL